MNIIEAAEVLELSSLRGIGTDEFNENIRRSYLSMVKKVHPDAGGDDEQFRKLQEAYTMLKSHRQICDMGIYENSASTKKLTVVTDIRTMQGIMLNGESAKLVKNGENSEDMILCRKNIDKYNVIIKDTIVVVVREIESSGKIVKYSTNISCQYDYCAQSFKTCKIVIPGCEEFSGKCKVTVQIGDSKVEITTRCRKLYAKVDVGFGTMSSEIELSI